MRFYVQLTAHPFDYAPHTFIPAVTYLPHDGAALHSCWLPVAVHYPVGRYALHITPLDLPILPRTTLLDSPDVWLIGPAWIQYRTGIAVILTAFADWLRLRRGRYPDS